MFNFIKRYFLYLLRWQLSTPILAWCVVWFRVLGVTLASVIANLIGGLIFFWVDRWIFRNTDILTGEVWEVREDIICADCGKVVDKGYRLVRKKNYDRTQDKKPQFRCPECSYKKYLRDFGKESSGRVNFFGAG